jgi:hypothetical protein
MRKYTEGNLRLGNSLIGRQVICLFVPDLGIWERAFSLQAFYKPVVGRRYTIRANVSSGSYTGLLLVEIRNPSVNLLTMSGEPFFPHCAFNVAQ